MALTDFQRHVCRLLARQRIASGESYVAGGAALSDALSSTRISRDIDLFPDTDAALDASWTRDRTVLLEQEYTVRVLRNRRRHRRRRGRPGWRGSDHRVDA
jgi:hypothetical protein